MRYFIGFLVTIGLIFLIIALLLGAGRSSKPSSPDTNKTFTLMDYANSDSTAELTIDGIVNADSQHTTTTIDVTSSDVTYNLLNGYQQNLSRKQSYPNNITAYQVFLQSLQRAGFTLHDTKIEYDERGYCPEGDRYILTFRNGGTDLRRSWTTTCSSAKGSFRGDLGTVLFLFKGQVPDYQKITQETSVL